MKHFLILTLLVTSAFAENRAPSLEALPPKAVERDGDTGCVLYALGWNGTDDGGTVVMNNQKPPKVDLAKGDWVWRWPAK